MKKKISILVFMLLLLLPAVTNSQSKAPLTKFEARDFFLNNGLKVKINEQINKNLSNVSVKTEDSQEKSPFLGALMSAVLPGAGEFYAKSFIKSAIFFAAEAGLWTTFAIFQNKGNEQTDLYHEYAHENWNVRKYARWLVNQQFSGYEQINPDEADLNLLRLQINEVERMNFSHTLPPYGDQQYYELIGKYQNFVAGWADVDINNLSKDPANPNYYGTYKSPMFVGYARDRQKANDYYDNSSLALSGVILNHILSAADAAWTVSMFNKEIRMKSSLKLENKYSLSEGRRRLIPVANLQVYF